MVSKKYPLLPIKVIEKAATGEPEAMEVVLQHYAGYIKSLSMYQGHFHSDIEDRLKETLMKAVLQFRLDR